MAKKGKIKNANNEVLYPRTLLECLQYNETTDGLLPTTPLTMTEFSSLVSSNSLIPGNYYLVKYYDLTSAQKDSIVADYNQRIGGDATNVRVTSMEFSYSLLVRASSVNKIFQDAVFVYSQGTVLGFTLKVRLYQGTIVISYMKDYHENEADYDFLNIQFKVFLKDEELFPPIESNYTVLEKSYYYPFPTSYTESWAFTFSRHVDEEDIYNAFTWARYNKIFNSPNCVLMIVYYDSDPDHTKYRIERNNITRSSHIALRSSIVSDNEFHNCYRVFGSNVSFKDDQGEKTSYGSFIGNRIFDTTSCDIAIYDQGTKRGFQRTEGSITFTERPNYGNIHVVNFKIKTLWPHLIRIVAPDIYYPKNITLFGTVFIPKRTLLNSKAAYLSSLTKSFFSLQVSRVSMEGTELLEEGVERFRFGGSGVVSYFMSGSWCNFPGMSTDIYDDTDLESLL